MSEQQINGAGLYVRGQASFSYYSLFPKNEIRFSGSMFLSLAVPFRPVMRLAQHLAVLHARSTTLAPGRHVVGIHFVELVNLGAYASVAFGALRTIADAQNLSLVGLPGIDRFLNAVVKYSNVQQAAVGLAVKRTSSSPERRRFQRLSTVQVERF